jgi:hypothetical protein
MFQIKVVEKIKTHLLCSITFSENRAIYEEAMREKYDRARKVIDCGIQHALPKLSLSGRTKLVKIFKSIFLRTNINVLYSPLSDALESPVKIFTCLPLKLEAMFITTLVT